MDLVNFLIIIIGSSLLLFARLPSAECSSAMKRLYEDLFADYNRLILPVANNKTKVVVTLGLKLGQILDLNLKQQILSTNVWVEQTWHDYKLEWSPELYDGIDMIHVPAENIWIPDIVLFNNADGNYELTLVAKARLYSNGTVVWKPPTMFRSTCEIDVEYFPFDIQTCYLRFGSWTYAGDEVELRHVDNKRKAEIGIDLSQFYKNVEWDIIDVPAYYNEVYYESYSEPFPDITFKIVIRRKMLFYLVNLILPVALMTFMTVSVFYLPSDSNEKVTLSISILTSLIVFFLLMLEIIPASSLAVPLFGKYLLFTLVLVSLSACVSVYVLNIHHRSPSVHAMSPTIKAIFLRTLPRLLRLNRPDPRERSSLNRFRKKKIAQQMLNNANKVYDLAQPLAASLNLIETLHKSYDFKQRINEEDDNLIADISNDETEDDEGRYFRRYVDNYIDKLEAFNELNETEVTKGTPGCNCDLENKSATVANNNHCSNTNRLVTSCCGGNNLDCTESSADMSCLLISNKLSSSINQNGCINYSTDDNIGNQSFHPKAQSCGCSDHQSTITHYHHPNNKIFTDDTLDMTFDYDDQDNYTTNNNGFAATTSGRFSANSNLIQQHLDESLPSPPPPPKPLAHISDSFSKNGRISSRSKNLTLSSSDEDERLSNNESHSNGKQSLDHGKLVDKLISSINFINNATEDIDTTTTTATTTTTTNREPIVHQYSIRSSELNEPMLQSQNTVICNQQSSTMFDSKAHILDDKVGCTCKQNSSELLNGFLNYPTNQPTVNLESDFKKPSDLLLSLRYSYDQMPAHVRAAIRSILFIADTIKNEDDENSAIEDWESMSMVVDRLFLWIFFLLCSFGSIIILALAPSLYDQRASIDDKLRIDIPPSNCSASVFAH